MLPGAEPICADFVCFDFVIVELALAKLSRIEDAQIIHHLQSTGCATCFDLRRSIARGTGAAFLLNNLT